MKSKIRLMKLLTQIIQCVSSMRFKSPKNSGTRASFERAGVVTITVSTRNEQVPEFKGILKRNRKALHNLGLMPEAASTKHGIS